MITKTKYKHRFDRIYFKNRWTTPRWHRSGTWLIFGVQQWFAGPFDYSFQFCFFGLEVHLWFIRKPIGQVEYKVNTTPDVIE